MKNGCWILAMGFLSLITACKKDKETLPVNMVSFAGKSHLLNNGYVLDYGTTESGYTNYDFIFTDGAYSLSESDFSNAKLALYAELFSPNTTTFQTGLYQYRSNIGGNSQQFYDAQIGFDSNGDGYLTESDTYYRAQGGSIRVEGAPFNYTITFDLQMENGKSLRGVFHRPLTYQDARYSRAPGSQLRSNSMPWIK